MSDSKKIKSDRPSATPQRSGSKEPRDWVWMPHAAHFICGRGCRFHLATAIGGHLISTVGEYLPDSAVREIYAQSRGVTPEDRAMRGSRHKKAKLAEGQVAEILARLEMGANRADLAREFRVSWDLIDRIKRGVCWKHVPRTPVDLSPSSGKPRAAPPKAVEVSDPPTERK